MIPSKAAGLVRSGHLVPLAVAFIIANSFAMVKGFYWLNLLPIALLVIWGLIVRPNAVLLFLAFATPLSINLEDLDTGGIGISLPTEPLMVLLMGLYLLATIQGFRSLPEGFRRHPITIIALLQLGWMIVTSATSTMPLVSFKAVLARTWFLVVCYFMVAALYKADRRNMERYQWLHVGGLVLVIIYTLFRHAQYSFDHDPAHWVMSPFYKDHTSYGMVLAFVMPFVVLMTVRPGISLPRRTTLIALTGYLLLALVLSYTRAAWLSLVPAIGLFILLRLRITLRMLALPVAAIGLLLVANFDNITRILERNDTESSDDLAEHISSMSNISTDASNLERINRWNSALRMFEDKPVLGFGPGTYVFQYAPYQAPEDRTIISTNFGDVGNAHSEYLGPLAEQGLLGPLLFILLFVVMLQRGGSLWRRMPAGTDRTMVMAAILGLTTYFVHGTLNNFLDLDKASVPFWAMMALIVVHDLRYPAEKRQVSKAISSK